MSSTSRLPLARAAIVSLSLPIDAASSSGVLPSWSAACSHYMQQSGSAKAWNCKCLQSPTLQTSLRCRLSSWTPDKTIKHSSKDRCRKVLVPTSRLAPAAVSARAAGCCCARTASISGVCPCLSAASMLTPGLPSSALIASTCTEHRLQLVHRTAGTLLKYQAVTYTLDWVTNAPHPHDQVTATLCRE